VTGELLDSLPRGAAELRVVLLRAHDDTASVELGVWTGVLEPRWRVSIRPSEFRRVAAALLRAAQLVEGGR
jgi:hypothetical protein